MTLGRGEARELLARHGVEPRRSLGQHFVVDPNTVRRVAELAGVGPGDAVIEVGPGLGALTLALVETGAEVTALEVDHGLVQILHEVVGDRAHLVEGDAMAADWDTLLAAHDEWVLVANLPYNVATPLVLDVLAHVPAVRRGLVMVQLEVAERLVAGPGSRACGIPSVKVRHAARAEIVGRVPATVFLPAPRVESALVAFVRHDAPVTQAPPGLLFDLVDRAFGQRRKMLRRSLADVVAAGDFEAAGVAATSRPEQLDLAAWDRLATRVGARGAAT